MPSRHDTNWITRIGVGAKASVGIRNSNEGGTVDERLSRLETHVGDLTRRLDRIERILAGREEPEERVVEAEPPATPLDALSGAAPL